MKYRIRERLISADDGKPRVIYHMERMNFWGCFVPIGTPKERKKLGVGHGSALSLEAAKRAVVHYAIARGDDTLPLIYLTRDPVDFTC